MKHETQVMNLLAQLNGEGTTIVRVIHSPEDAAVGKRIVRRLDGKIISDSNQ